MYNSLALSQCGDSMGDGNVLGKCTEMPDALICIWECMSQSESHESMELQMSVDSNARFDKENDSSRIFVPAVIICVLV